MNKKTHLELYITASVLRAKRLVCLSVIK